MFCRNCGANNADNAAFCVNCGTNLTNEQPVVQEPVQPVAQEPAQPVYQQPVYQQPAYQQPVQPVYQQPVYQQPVYQQPVYQQPVQPEVSGPMPGKILGIFGMILGILSFIIIFIEIFLSPVFAITGLVLSIIGKSKASNAGRTNGMAIAGMICSIVVLGIWVLGLIIGLAGVGALSYYF